MPRIIVEATPADRVPTMTLRERVVPVQLECGHFSTQLIERLHWAVLDAAEAEGGQRASADLGP
jgi:hypothetical protein